MFSFPYFKIRGSQSEWRRKIRTTGGDIRRGVVVFVLDNMRKQMLSHVHTLIYLSTQEL